MQKCGFDFHVGNDLIIILIGIHAQPSMEHLHIHVVSQDLHLDDMQEKTNCGIDQHNLLRK